MPRFATDSGHSTGNPNVHRNIDISVRRSVACAMNLNGLPIASASFPLLLFPISSRLFPWDADVDVAAVSITVRRRKPEGNVISEIGEQTAWDCARIDCRAHTLLCSYVSYNSLVNSTKRLIVVVGTRQVFGRSSIQVRASGSEDSRGLAG